MPDLARVGMDLRGQGSLKTYIHYTYTSSMLYCSTDSRIYVAIMKKHLHTFDCNDIVNLPLN